MKRKKPNKHEKKPARLSKNYQDEPTELELAFRQAEEQKKNQHTSKKPLVTKVKPEKVVDESPEAEPKQSPAVEKAAPSPGTPKPKRVYYPPQKEMPPKSAPIPPRPQAKKINKPKSSENRPAVNLRLEKVQDDAFNFDIDLEKEETQETSSFRSMETKKNGKIQIHEGNYNDESDVVIGFDFGTSSTKIVIRDTGRQTAYAIPFGKLAGKSNGYLLPTNIFIADDGIFSLSGGRHSFEHLKTQLLDNPEKIIFKAVSKSHIITASELSTAYMALVIQYARDWFLKHKKSIYKKEHIHWHINLGIPSKNYDENKMRNLFHTIAMAAWKLSQSDSSITLSDTKNTLLAAKKIDFQKNEQEKIPIEDFLWLHPDYVNTHPEVVMEVVGYVRSPLRTGGLHLLIDVGATTLDTATFIVHSKEDEDMFPLLETKVERYGTMELHNRRMKALAKRLNDHLRKTNSVDPLKPLPAPIDYDLDEDVGEISTIDETFFHECTVDIGEVVRNTKNHRDPYSQAWVTGLPVFICGGGGRHQLYRTMIKDIGERIAKSVVDFGGFVIKDIPKPDQLDAPDLSPQDYDRVAVAYGLSFTSLEIGKIIPESKIRDIQSTEKIVNVDKRYIGPEMC